jgi:hypothetical protein
MATHSRSSFNLSDGRELNGRTRIGMTPQISALIKIVTYDLAGSQGYQLENSRSGDRCGAPLRMSACVPGSHLAAASSG